MNEYKRIKSRMKYTSLRQIGRVIKGKRESNDKVKNKKRTKKNDGSGKI